MLNQLWAASVLCVSMDVQTAVTGLLWYWREQRKHQVCVVMRRLNLPHSNGALFITSSRFVFFLCSLLAATGESPPPHSNVKGWKPALNSIFLKFRWAGKLSHKFQNTWMHLSLSPAPRLHFNSPSQSENLGPIWSIRPFQKDSHRGKMYMFRGHKVQEQVNRKLLVRMMNDVGGKWKQAKKQIHKQRQISSLKLN